MRVQRENAIPKGCVQRMASKCSLSARISFRYLCDAA